MDWSDKSWLDADNLQSLMAPVYAVTWIMFMILEWKKPAREYKKIRGYGIFGILFLFVGHIFSVTALVFLPEQWLKEHTLIDLTDLGLVGGTVFVFVTESFLYYWYHRAQHRFAFLWRIHQTHHSMPRFGSVGSYIIHPLDSGINFIFDTFFFTFVFGAHPAAVLIALYFTFVITIFEHANARTPKWIGYLCARPEEHNVHHARGIHGGNYSEWPMLWDRLFGTYRKPPESPMEVGFGHPSWYSVLLDSLMLADISSPAYFKKRYGDKGETISKGETTSPSP